MWQPEKNFQTGVSTPSTTSQLDNLSESETPDISRVQLFLFGIISSLQIFAIVANFIIDAVVLNKIGGFWAIVVGLFVFPLTEIVIPWYALFAFGWWWPLAVGYGLFVVARLLQFFSPFKDDEKEE